MLVLSRQRDETIMIGDDIEITVVDIRGDKIRLGISAPARIAVHRKEVYEAIRRENEQAAQNTTLDVLPAGPAKGSPVRPGPARSRARPEAAKPRLATPVGPPPIPPAEPPPPPTATTPRARAGAGVGGP